MIVKIALVAALVLSLAEGCEKSKPEKRPPQFEEAEIQNLCVVNSFAVFAHNPHQSKGTPTDMTGKTWVTCEVPMSDVHIEIKIQRQIDPGRWIDHTNVTHCRGITIGAGAAGKTQCMATAPCPKDRPTTKFRTAARAQGVHEGTAAGMTAWKYSGEVLVPCR